MASELDQKSLEQAFQGRPDIQGAIKAAAGMSLFSKRPCVTARARPRMKSFSEAAINSNRTTDLNSHTRLC
jgi:hypothetical protein